MAAWLDVQAMLAQGLGRDARLHLASIYRPAALPGWLLSPWRQAQRETGDGAPVLVVNCKGDKPGDVVCMVRLADLERLTAR